MNLLVGVDGSDLGYRALEQTVRRVAETGDPLTVAVLGPPETREDVLAEVHDQLEGAAVEAEVRELDDETGSQLVELADGGDFDRLIIGGGYHSPLGKIQLGTIGEYVLTNATTSVTLVR